MRTPNRLLARFALTVACASAVVAPAQAFAAASTASGSAKCTVTARHPRLDTLTNTLRGYATVTCNVSTVIGVETTVVEMDGAVESATAVAREVRWVAVNGGVATMVMTARGVCLNTEPGNEEFASKARVLLMGSVSAWDRTVPDPDSYAC